METFAVVIRGIRSYDIFTEHETINVACYLGFLRGLRDRAMTIKGMQSGYLRKAPDFIAMPKLLSGLNQKLSNPL